jgi:mono/diheme cytochrome c family protein
MAPVDRAHLLIGGFILFFLVVLTSCGAPPKGNPEEGKRWYMMNNCSSCHGQNGNDGRGANIAGITMGFGSFVKKLRKTDAPIMPPFPESKISEQDAADIYAFLKTLK